MQNAQIYTIVALAVYAAARALIGCMSFGKSKTLDGFPIVVPVVSLLTKERDPWRVEEIFACYDAE